MAKFPKKISFYSALETFQKYPWAVFNTNVKGKTPEILGF
jgi:hypothetical protein